MTLRLPDDVTDEELWFPCAEVAGGRDYLYPAVWHTFPGRMGAYCPAKDVYYRVSADAITDAPEATRYWVKGYLAGSLPSHPAADQNDIGEPSAEELAEWTTRAKEYFRTGRWT